MRAFFHKFTRQKSAAVAVSRISAAKRPADVSCGCSPGSSPSIRLAGTKAMGDGDIVLAGASGEAMAFGPAEFPTIMGNRVTLLAAHRDTHFAWLRDLKADDELTLERIDGRETRYRVMALETVRWDEFTVSSQPHRETLLLATRFPFNGDAPGPLRRVAHAVRVN